MYWYSKKERVGELLRLECRRCGLDPAKSRVFTMDGEVMFRLCCGFSFSLCLQGDEILPETVLAADTTLEDALLAPMQRVCIQTRTTDVSSVLFWVVCLSADLTLLVSGQVGRAAHRTGQKEERSARQDGISEATLFWGREKGEMQSINAASKTHGLFDCVGGSFGDGFGGWCER